MDEEKLTNFTNESFHVFSEFHNIKEECVKLLWNLIKYNSQKKITSDEAKYVLSTIYNFFIACKKIILYLILFGKGSETIGATSS